MRIAIFVTGAYVRPEFLEAVSGHVQIPLMAAGILLAAGHEVTLITTRPSHEHCLPHAIPDALDVREIVHATSSWPQHSTYPVKAARQFLQLRTSIRKGRFDVIHFFGGTGTALLLCALRYAGVNTPCFYTPIKRLPCHRSALRSRMLRSMLGRVSRVITTSSYVSFDWAALCGEHKVRTLRPGIMKEIVPSSNGSVRDSVLFWRNAAYGNGVDIAIESFRKLASKYANIRFVFAVRPHDTYESDLLRLCREFNNIDTHIYPYQDGVSLAELLRRALFVIQPFRRLSINPQLSILETLYAGVPVVATSVESNPEVVRHGQTGLLIAPDDERALSGAIETLLNDRRLLGTLTENARSMTRRQWNWDSFGRGLLDEYDALR